MSAQPSPQTLRADIDELADQVQEYENKDDPRTTIEFYERLQRKLERLSEVDELDAQNASQLSFVNDRLADLRDMVAKAKESSSTNGDASTDTADTSTDADDTGSIEFETETESTGDGEPSTDSPFEPSVPDTSLSEYVGREELKSELVSRILGPLRDPNEVERLGLSSPSGGLLEGPPGTGKSRLVKALSAEAELEFIKVKVPDIVDKYKGNTGKNIRELFETAADHRPCIVCLDEVDALTGERGGNDGAGESRMVNVFLDELENAPDGVITFGTTNRPDIIDDAFKEKDRFDKSYTLDLPEARMRLRLLEFYLEDHPHDLSPDTVMEVARGTEGYSCREIHQVVTEAAWDVFEKDQQRITPENIRTGVDAVTPLEYEYA